MRCSMTAGSSRSGGTSSEGISAGRYEAARQGVNRRSTLSSTELSRQLEPRARALWDRYAYPEWLRRHSLVVGRVAVVIATAMADQVDVTTVGLAAYLHDIGRSPLLAGERRQHNQLSALVLAAEGLTECAELALRHPVYAVLDDLTRPRTLAERIVYYADRRGGMEVLTLDERIGETAARYPEYAERIERSRPIAHEIERDLYAELPWRPEDLAGMVAQLT